MELKESIKEYSLQRRQPVDARDLLRVDPKDRASCQRFHFSLAHLTAYSVHWLTLWEIPTTYENISVLNGRLFPSDFGLPGFPEFPGETRTLRSILQMRPKYRGFATSDPRKGVFLTEKGREVAAKVLEAIGAPTFEGRQIEQDIIPDNRGMPRDKQYTRNPAQIIADCKGKLLHRRHTEGKFEETDVVHFLGLLSLYDHTPPLEVRKAFRQVRADAQAAGDEEFLVFLDRVEERFSAYLNRADKQ